MKTIFTKKKFARSPFSQVCQNSDPPRTLLKTNILISCFLLWYCFQKSCAQIIFYCFSRLVDTSTRHIVIPSSKFGREDWHYCAVCEAVAPPRAWHCSTCKLCILKREHHCMFAGYCVGHFNHRYFILFLAWTWMGVVYCTYLNTVYVYLEVVKIQYQAVKCDRYTRIGDQYQSFTLDCNPKFSRLPRTCHNKLFYSDLCCFQLEA